MTFQGGSQVGEQKRRYKAVIGNHTYTIIGAATPEHFAATTQLLNAQLAQIKALSPAMSDEQAAILLAFNAVSDVIKQQEAQEQAE
ncbi:cell division protein ZapA [Lacticaseibacillus mingshuiensis]|uniref:Cell division protein ZapA n=1 Tax=Lacticaseibacillus mingshuiensis TaxID=2799574 RepID=A0ABW4CGJ7_9LACO